MFEKLSRVEERYNKIAADLCDPAVVADISRYTALMKEQKHLTPVVETFARYKTAKTAAEEARELLQSESDPELCDLAREELKDSEVALEQLQEQLKILLLPRDPNDDKNVIIEIRGGAGGDESALFAGVLYRMYSMYAEQKGFKSEILSENATELGGYKEISFSIDGDGAYSRFKFESGVHRVQRVPETESQGRIHTSTVTVAVLPEAEEVELDINPEDLRFDVFRSSGPGGQCVNTTDSAVRVTHIPTGIAVASQQEKSQHRNKEIALRILYARLLEAKQQEEQAKQAADKRSQVGTGDRSERIRTYNFPQNRVTDHRFNITNYALGAIMEGDLDALLEPIIAIDCERRLEALNQAE